MGTNFMNDFSISQFFTRVLRYWWLLICLMVAGGLLGVLLAVLHPPVYESSAVITSSLDYARLGRLDDWEEDQQYIAIGDVIGSTEVKQKVIAAAQQNGIEFSESELANAFFLDRQDTRWVLRVRTKAPNLSTQLNELWSAAAIDALIEKRDAMSESLTLQQRLNSLALCFEQSIVVEPGSSECTVENLSEIREEMSTIASTYEIQNYQSSLLFSRTSFELTTEATFPSTPVLHERNFLVLAGALAGFCLGMILFTAGFPKNKETTKQ
jgi:uncharacterized protein involved in exopolysaccharide biosynthesis